MTSTFPPTYHYRPWATSNQQQDPYWTYDGAFTKHTLAFGTSPSPPMQPLQRFLQESDRPLFTSGSYEKDPTMHPFPDVPSQSLKYVDYDGVVYPLPHRHPSPSNSGFLSSHNSSDVSDRDHSPWSSPYQRAATYPPEAVYTETGLHASGGYAAFQGHNAHPNGHCVALHDVQQYADAQPEIITSDDEPTAYGSYAQEGYQPIHDDPRIIAPCVPSQPLEPSTSSGTSSGEAAPAIRRGRAPSTRSLTSPRASSKIAKRPSPGRRLSIYRGKGAGNEVVNTNGNSARAFPCPFAPYSCRSTFGSKNEWKRHVHTQHMRLGFWRCDQCPSGERKPNDFNRKDLFIQHVRRMHPVTSGGKKAASKSRPSRARGSKDDAEEEILAATQRRCYRKLRAPPARSGCLFCEAEFVGPATWEERMEHVGRHMEAAKKGEDAIVDSTMWQVDQATEDWLLREGLVMRQKSGLKLV